VSFDVSRPYGPIRPVTRIALLSVLTSQFLCPRNYFRITNDFSLNMALLAPRELGRYRYVKETDGTTAESVLDSRRSSQPPRLEQPLCDPASVLSQESERLFPMVQCRKRGLMFVQCRFSESVSDHLCGLVVRIPGYISRGQDSISGATRIF
jgi:hypothetical protein